MRLLPGAVALFVLALATMHSARASAAGKKPHVHDGFFLRMEAGTGPVWLSSTGSASNGFAQEIPSSARGLFAPVTGLAVGGTFEKLGLVLAGRLGVSSAHEPVFDTLGQRFTIRDSYLTLVDLTAVVEYYPRLDSGLHFGVGFGPAALGVSSGRLGAGFGFAAALQAGHAFFFARQWSLGADLRAAVTRTYGRGGRDIQTTAFSPSLCLTVTVH